MVFFHEIVQIVDLGLYTVGIATVVCKFIVNGGLQKTTIFFIDFVISVILLRMLDFSKLHELVWLTKVRVYDLFSSLVRYFSY